MASCITSQWSNSTTPQAKLVVEATSNTDTSTVLTWTLYYVAHGYAANTTVNKSWTVTVGGQSWEGTYNIDGKTGTHEIFSGTKTITKTKSSQSISFSVSFGFNLTWSDVYGGTKTASGSISVSAKTSYTVSYNANGGSGAPSSQTKWHGESLTISSTKPTKTGYTFKGWGTSTTDTTADYSAGGSYTANASDTLYAVWSENTLTINYYSNYADYCTYQGKTVSVSSSNNVVVTTSTIYYDNSYGNGLSDVQNVDYLYLSRTGYTPTGYWGTSQSGGTLIDQKTSFSTGQAFAQAFGKSLTNGNASVNVYPQWEINTYTISYNANGGSGTIPNQTVDYNEGFTIATNTFKRDGYKFIGYNVQRSSDSKWYVAGQKWTSESDIELNGYTKKIYAEGEDNHVMGQSWTDGNTETDTFTFYAIWEISGVVYIDNGIALEPYLTYIDNGTSWDLYLAYINDGENWVIIS